MEMPTKETAIASNREAWNDSARHHRDNPEWPALLSAVERNDFSCLDTTLHTLLEQVGVAGKDLVQVGCNNGRESLSLFALGARSVVGIDQSAAFLDQARELGARSPHPAQFIEADIHLLPTELHEQFDLALITIGVLNWMPDIGEFFRHVARILKPGGKLGLVWNMRDARVSWVRKLNQIVDRHEGDAPRFYTGEWRKLFPFKGLDALQEQVFMLAHQGAAEDVIYNRVRSTSFIAALPPQQQEEVIDEIRQLVAEEEELQGKENLTVPYQTKAYFTTKL